MSTSFSPIPVILVTGFLGAGKTTFLNWLIANSPQTKCSFILNEFGDIKLESQFLRHTSESVIELANGCMCCVAKSDIPRVVMLILENSPETQYIVIEASGLSDPEPIVSVLRAAPLNQRVQLQQIIAVVDGTRFEDQSLQHPIILSQIADADCVVLSKLSVVTPVQLEAVERHLHQLVPITRILRMDDTMTPAVFFQPATPSTHTTHDQTPLHAAHEGYESFWLSTTDILDFDAVRDWCNCISPQLLRIKGIIMTMGEKKWLVQSVHGGAAEFAASEWLADEPRQTAILCVGQHLDAQQIRAGFAALHTIKS